MLLPDRRARYLVLLLQAASAGSFVAAGSDDLLIASSQTSLTAFFTAVVSPAAALAHTASSFDFELAGSVVAAWISRLQASTACGVANEAAPLGAVLPVELVAPVLAGATETL